MINVTNQAHGADWSFYNADCVDAIQGIPDNSVGLSVYSPPFSSVFTYSDLDRDMGNCASDDEFMQHYSYIIGEVRRVTMPGRLTAVHCRDLLALQSKEGFQGLKDFPGWIIQAHIDAGWTYHSRITVWKDPVVEMQRTKAHGLLYKTLQADSSRSRQGCADYLLIFRRRPEDGETVTPVTQDAAKFPVTQWQEWASPVWMTINQGNVLNVAEGRSEQDERHMCPLQLDLIDRAVRLWSNPGDVILSPFGGIGSEGVGALRAGRKFVGIELKPEYWRVGCDNLRGATAQMSMF